MSDMLKVVILAGGSGTRLWPLSRQDYPKQFIKLKQFNNRSLLQETLIRHKSWGKPTVIVGEAHRFIAAQQIQELNITADLIVEPVAKNSAPCAILAALMSQKENFSTVLLTPADLLITEPENYHIILKNSLDFLKDHKNNIITLGIQPTQPHTGYGYIQLKDLINKNNNFKIYRSDRFIEKPDLETAKRYLDSKNYLWNSGIFLYNTDYFLETAKSTVPEMVHQVARAFTTAHRDLDFVRLDKVYYEKIESCSVDYAIMEKISELSVVAADFGWHDLGSWDRLWEVSPHDSHQNYLAGDIIINQVENSYIYAEQKLVTAIGLKNIIVIDSEDALLIADRTHAENIKNIVNILIKNKRKEAIESVKTFRPWGYYQTIDHGDLYQVKRIVVYIKQALSLQYHHHRAEHWVIVRGVAEVILGDKIHQFIENDSVYIPKNMKHRLKNIGEIELQLIEVQTGNYLGEDDIVRLVDDYGRN